MKKIAIIGCGNLGASLVDGLIDSKFCIPANLYITKRNTASLSKYHDIGVNVYADNKAAAQMADVIILAVKPFQLMEILNEIKSECSDKILISVVTGVFLKDIKSHLFEKVSVFRAMPNTAIAIKESITCLSSIDGDNNDLEYVVNLFNCLGKVVVINENLMDAATVLGACGIAFAMRFIRANIQAGIEIGFDAKTAGLIAAQTVKGAAQLLLTNGLHPEQEIDKVTTPKGCTIAGLNEMEHQGFSSSLIKGLIASFKKINN